MLKHLLILTNIQKQKRDNKAISLMSTIHSASGHIYVQKKN